MQTSLIEIVTAEMRKDWFYNNGWYADDDVIAGWYSNKIKEDEMDYKIIRSTHASHVEKEVTVYLNKGYVVSGSIFVAAGLIHQAVVKAAE